jgi:hypothetical protein
MADGGYNGPAEKKGTALVVYPAAVKNDVMVYELLIAKEAELKKELSSCRSHMRSIRHNFYCFMGEEDLGTIQGDNFSVHAKRKSSHQGFAEGKRTSGRECNNHEPYQLRRGGMGWISIGSSVAGSAYASQPPCR